MSRQPQQACRGCLLCEQIQMHTLRLKTTQTDTTEIDGFDWEAALSYYILPELVRRGKDGLEDLFVVCSDGVWKSTGSRAATGPVEAVLGEYRKIYALQDDLDA